MTQLKVEYFAKQGAKISDKDAKVIGPEIERLGSPKAQDIVNAARDESSPLHPYFEWDDQIAAEEYRKAQARTYAASIIIYVDENPVRAFEAVTLRTSDENQPEENKPYVPHSVVFSDNNLSQQVIGRAKRQLETWRSTYETYRKLAAFENAFGSVFSAILELEDEKSPVHS